jgi:hypothetical protein
MNCGGSLSADLLLCRANPDPNPDQSNPVVARAETPPMELLYADDYRKDNLKTVCDR